uniref:LuxR C-terminal-related transcriptional regulator n=1 Tax=Aminobacter niigataensis TaxID=83265 RepID=UPI0028527FCB|nr:response regulator transcription factor [Aminobacter niigataensis]WMD00148.1 response regulator transcription factor [Aminobacter niigataensis]
MKVLIADDHWFIRDSLKHVVKKVRLALEPIEAGSFDEAIELLADNPDVELMLIDLVMPGFSEFEGLRTLRRAFPDIPIAVISVHEDRDFVINAITEGVVGYIPKSAGGAEILNALTLIINGSVYFPRQILQGTVGAKGPKRVGNTQLTSREEEVLNLVREGQSNATIAEMLDLSPNTVRVHIRNLMLKVDAKDRQELASYGTASPSRSRGAA